MTSSFIDQKFNPLPFASDIARGKTANESQQYDSRSASFAVDGNYTRDDNDRCATADPDRLSNYSWWQVDLGDIYVVTTVTLYPAADSVG
jgi:hypothetical protein